MASKQVEEKQGNTGKEKAHQPTSEDDLRRGKILMGVFISLLVILGAVYVWAHYQRPAGLFAPTSTALDVVGEAKVILDAAGGDVLEPGVVAQLTQLGSRLALLAPQLGAGSGFSGTLSQVNTELSSNEVHKAVLIPLFDQLENIVKVGSGSYFWSGSLDRWIELLFWTIVGTLVFLLSEIKKYSSQPYKKYRDFIRYTPWYIVNLFRGPFIAMVIMLALLSLSFDAIGISVDLKSAPIEVLIVTAAILGYYSRIADKELDIITGTLFKAAWDKANPSKPPDQQGKPQEGESLEPTPATPADTLDKAGSAAPLDKPVATAEEHNENPETKTEPELLPEDGNQPAGE